MVTSPYSAEYGRSPGAAISVSTKSGTNDFHGTGYDYFRNESFDSIDFFSKRANAAKPANDQNQFGGNLGGPMVKGRAFFFADYEGTRITRGVTRLTRVPTLDDRAGVFSAAIRDPVTDSRSTTTPFRPTASTPTPRRSSTCAAAESAGRQQLLQERRSPRQLRPAARPAALVPRHQRQHLRPLHLFEPQAPDPRRLRRRRRHRDVGVRQPDHPDQRSRRLDPHPDGRRWSTSSGCRIRARNQTRAAAVRHPAAERRDDPGSVTDPIVAGGLPGITIDGYFWRVRTGPHRLARLPAEVPAHQPVRVPRHGLVDPRRAISQGGGRSDDADGERVHGRSGDARRCAATRSPATRWPTTCSATSPTSSCRTCRVVQQRHSAQMFFVQDDWKATRGSR